MKEFWIANIQNTLYDHISSQKMFLIEPLELFWLTRNIYMYIFMKYNVIFRFKYTLGNNQLNKECLTLVWNSSLPNPWSVVHFTFPSVPPHLPWSLNILLFFFCGTRSWTQDLNLEPLHQALFLCVGYFPERVSQTICLGWLQTSIPLI
jgi:hypothetical protein